MAFKKDMVTPAKANRFFQKEVYLDRRPDRPDEPGEDIGEETHRADQTISSMRPAARFSMAAVPRSPPTT